MKQSNKLRQNIQVSESSCEYQSGVKTSMLSKGKQRQCSPALRSLIGCFKTKNPVDIVEILDVFK